MKILLKNTFALLFAVLISAHGFSQLNLETKVADILAQLPTRDLEHLDKLMKDILDLGEAGIANITDRIIPPGTGNDTRERYAIESLARYSGAPNRGEAKRTTEKSLLSALEKASDKNVKSFFIQRLLYCGSDASTDILGKYLTDDILYSPATMVLTSIGTEKAGQVLLANLPNTQGNARIHVVKALGEIKFQPAESAISALANQSSGELKRESLQALANLGMPASERTMANAAATAGFKNDESGAVLAYLHYARQLAQNGNHNLSNKLSNTLLKRAKDVDQLHFRSAAVRILRENQGEQATKLLVNEFRNSDKAYRGAILGYAAQGMISADVGQWIRAMKKAPDQAKVQIISMLAKRDEPQVLRESIIPSLSDNSEEVRIEAIKALAVNQKKNAIPLLLERLATGPAAEETLALKNALLATVGIDEANLLASKMSSLNDSGKAVVVEVIGSRRATSYFGLVLDQTRSSNKELSTAAFAALRNVAGPNDLKPLLTLLDQTNDAANVASVQQAIIASLEQNQSEGSRLILSAYQQNGKNIKLIPVFPYIDDAKAYEIVAGMVEKGTQSEKEAALEALVNWRNPEAIPLLFELIENQAFQARAFTAYLRLTMASEYPADQKLLLVRKLMPVAANVNQKRAVLNAAGNIRTFLSLVFIDQYLDDQELSAAASSAAMSVFLPTPAGEPGLTGEFVREVAQKVKRKITGPDSQYFIIDIDDYLERMPREKGFVSIFNGRDLTGWQGLVKNPIARAKMSAKELAAEQAKANERMHQNWSVKDGNIIFNGKGDNLSTVKEYGDFEMLVDWKITRGGDSGIYLRGSPQVQIWDTALVKVGAQVGSGGLYNNKIHRSTPLVVADNPVGEWNTFRIKMVGEKVTVYLNGILVVDEVVLENFWDRSIPIFPKGPIELQAHGSDLEFRNIFVKELDGGDELLSEEEKADGFKSLFNGTNLDGWTGNTQEYIAENGVIAVKPKKGGHGNLYTVDEYSDFIFRFEFKLTPGANNGLGIHTPLKGDAAYVGKELQILDDTAPIYANLKPWQFHGSVYGIVAAKKGSLKPVGEWNYQEVVVKGDNVKITLNGNVILDANLAEATKNGTLDGRDHPGLKQHKGHIAFLGHGSELYFRNIRIKDLSGTQKLVEGR